jgi:hypothetical protein
MYERSLQVLDPSSQQGPAMMPFDTPGKDPHELYLCGCCRVLLDRIMAPSLLERAVILCPNCGSVNLP